MITTQKMFRFLLFTGLIVSTHNYMIAMERSPSQERKRERKEQTCPICQETIPRIKLTSTCGHAYCLDCLISHHAQCVAHEKETLCPLCKRSIQKTTRWSTLKERLEGNAFFSEKLFQALESKRKDLEKQTQDDTTMATTMGLEEVELFLIQRQIADLEEEGNPLEQRPNESEAEYHIRLAEIYGNPVPLEEEEYDDNDGYYSDRN